jgi:hypothetical protein
MLHFFAGAPFNEQPFSRFDILEGESMISSHKAGTVPFLKLFVTLTIIAGLSASAGEKAKKVLESPLLCRVAREVFQRAGRSS